MNLFRLSLGFAAGLLLTAATAAPTYSQDKVRVGVFPVSTSLPYFVAADRGFFKEQNIEPEMIRMIGGPPIVAGMISNQIDAAAVLVTIEGMNANIKKPGVAMYISLNSSNRKYQMEQFVVRKGLAGEIKTIADLKGRKIMAAPGPANVNMAKAVLAANGLKDGDYKLDQLDMGQHVNAMTAGTFDAGYTLEPNAATMRKLGVAVTLEGGIVARYVLGNPDANVFSGGGAITSDFMKNRPDVARRYVLAWEKAVRFIMEHPDEARKNLSKNTFTPDDVIDTVPMQGYFMVKGMSDNEKEEAQKYIDFAVQIGVLERKINIKDYLSPL